MSARVAGAPISWGVIEVPDWGYQMPADRVLREAASLGLTAMEAGPEGFLPDGTTEVAAVLGGHGLSLVGGFVPAVLHVPDVLDEQLAFVERRADFFAAAGADVVVLAASTGSENYGEVFEADEDAWSTLFASLGEVERICERHGVAVSLHQHFGTVIERDDQLRRFLDGSDMGLCLDTGHLAIGGSDPVEIARLAAGRVNHVHLKDVDYELAARLASRELDFREAAEQGAFRPLGDGDIDIGRLLEVLDDGGYSGWYVLEQDSVVEDEPPEGEGPLRDVKKSLTFVENSLNGGSKG
ncbi:MAG TPA: TIM barrel protein [Rubrobacter sp.]|nr:TIM barrel protein [Rubrobacter sp.]